MITIFPESSLATFALIVFLTRAPGYKLNGGRDTLGIVSILHQEMNMIGGHRIVQDLYTISFPRLWKPRHEPSAVMSEFQQKLLFVATMGDVPDTARDKMSIGSCHGPPPPCADMNNQLNCFALILPLKIGTFSHFAIFCLSNSNLFGSDPGKRASPQASYHASVEAVFM
jgi:hypothetical protein